MTRTKAVVPCPVQGCTDKVGVLIESRTGPDDEPFRLAGLTGAGLDHIHRIHPGKLVWTS